MTDTRGTFEHACGAEPRPEHGYCTDDMARVLVVTTREPEASGDVNRLAGLAVRFLGEAQTLTGACRNRMDAAGKWTDDTQPGRLLGQVHLGAGNSCGAQRGRLGAQDGARPVRAGRTGDARRGRGRWRMRRLGAAEVLSVHPDHRAARKLITDYAVSTQTSNGESAEWPWPEPRLSYANAVLAEAMIAAGVALEAPKLWQRGLELLGWLLEGETTDGHLSPTPVAGRGPGDPRPAFDQQPIEVAALADACARAAAVDASSRWPEGVRAAAAWFEGVNDIGQRMWDPETGGGFDGLQEHGVNRNQGAESTLAVISTLQHAQRMSLLQR